VRAAEGTPDRASTSAEGPVEAGGGASLDGERNNGRARCPAPLFFRGAWQRNHAMRRELASGRRFTATLSFDSASRKA